MTPYYDDGAVALYQFDDLTVPVGRTHLYRLEDEDGLFFGPWVVRVPSGRVYLPVVSR